MSRQASCTQLHFYLSYFFSSFGYVLVYGWYIANLANSLNRRKMQQAKASTNKRKIQNVAKTAKLPAWENSHNNKDGNNKNKHNFNDNDNKENNKDPCFCCSVVWGRRLRGMSGGSVQRTLCTRETVKRVPRVLHQVLSAFFNKIGFFWC